MNTSETAKYTGIPAEVLVRMRARETRSRKSGPPFCKVLSAVGDAEYVYSKREIKQWLRLRNCLITAGDAAVILGLHREDILSIHGVQSFTVKKRGYRGRLVVDNTRKIYIWLGKK